MLGHLTGRVIKPGVVATAGIGWVVTSPDELTVGSEVSLHITSIMRDQGINFYGFVDPDDQLFFEALIKVPKVGPQIALSLLKEYTPPVLAHHIASSNLVALSKVPGVGKRSAETICAMVHVPRCVSPTPAEVTLVDEVITSLGALGFDPELAASAARQAQANSPELSDEELLRRALSLLRSGS